MDQPKTDSGPRTSPNCSEPAERNFRPRVTVPDLGVVEAENLANGIGGCVALAGKVWFLDRMVWLYEDMKNSTTEYSGWLYNKNAEPAD